MVFFSKVYTNTIKGLAAIVVILVHIHESNGNALQDAIGSFAYVAVTFFFLVSAFGMQMSAEKKGDYMKYFWRNRLVSLLIPMLLVNIAGIVVSCLWNGHIDCSKLWDLNGYVKVLLIYCVWFWVIEFIRKKFEINRCIADLILIMGVVASSLLLYVFTHKDISADSGWCFERMGLVWGFLLYRYFDIFIEWMDKYRCCKMFVALFLSLIFGAAYLKFKTVWFVGEYLLKIVLGLTLLVSLFLWTSKLKVGNCVSQFLGNISYEVYLVHGLVMGIICHYAELSSGMFVICSVLGSILLAYVLHSVGSPIVKYLRK